MINSNNKGETMRYVTQQIKDAFAVGESKKVDNTETDGNSVWLHGNEIIRRVQGGIEWTLAGWGTPTTRERINGILGVGVYQKNHCQMLDGVEINDEEWYRL